VCKNAERKASHHEHTLDKFNVRKELENLTVIYLENPKMPTRLLVELHQITSGRSLSHSMYSKAERPRSQHELDISRYRSP
jgi:hypothetical protein